MDELGTVFASSLLRILILEEGLPSISSPVFVTVHNLVVLSSEYLAVWPTGRIKPWVVGCWATLQGIIFPFDLSRVH